MYYNNRITFVPFFFHKCLLSNRTIAMILALLGLRRKGLFPIGIFM